MRCELRSHVTCRHINKIYYLKCNIYDHKETYFGKTVGDDVVTFKNCKFPMHMYHRAMKNNLSVFYYWKLHSEGQMQKALV